MNKAIFIVVLTFLLGVLWIASAKWIFRNQEIRGILILKSIVVITCLGLPVLHYLMTIAEGHPYITSSNNFFADNLFLRFINWALIIVLVFGVNRVEFKQKPETDIV